jgi:hypothetical protein
MRPYAPRPIRFDGLRTPGAWRVKTYVLTLPDEPFDRSRFADGERRALAELPAETSAARPGLALLVLHQGRGADYAVLGWWDRENELPLRVWVRPHDEPAWRPARGGESLCVWDLQVLWHEREAYVATVLADGDATAYLARTLHAPAPGAPPPGAPPPSAPPLALHVVDEPLAVVRLAADAGVPAWATAAPFHSVTRTDHELSVVCADARVPAGVAAARGWRALVVAGPLDLALVGVLARLAVPLAAAGVAVFPLATHDTHYLLVREAQLDAAVRALRDAGCQVPDAPGAAREAAVAPLA